MNSWPAILKLHSLSDFLRTTNSESSSEAYYILNHLCSLAGDCTLLHNNGSWFCYSCNGLHRYFQVSNVDRGPSALTIVFRGGADGKKDYVRLVDMPTTIWREDQVCRTLGLDGIMFT